MKLHQIISLKRFDFGFFFKKRDVKSEPLIDNLTRGQVWLGKATNDQRALESRILRLTK